MNEHPAPPPGQPEPDVHPVHRELPRWLLPVLGGAILLLVAANNIGNVMWSQWVGTRPLALIALNSTNKFLLATSINAPFGLFVVVATLRLLAPDPLFFAIGHLYGDRALHWARDVFPGSRALLDDVRDPDGAVRRVLGVLVLVMPNNPVCLIAGVTRYPIRRFVVLNLVGTVGRVLLMWWIGHLFRDEIASLLDLVGRYQRWFLLASVIGVAAYLAWQIVGRRGLIGGVEELEEELGED